MTLKFNPSDFEKKWIHKWIKDKLYKTGEDQSKKKFYSLYSFPYPSGTGLHVGHVEGMVANDIVARYYRMKGYNSTLPMGWDSFGLPAENFAIKTGTHPSKSTEDIISNFIDQINNVGISVDWDKEVAAHRPDYYRWTQWLFIQLFKKGLAYRRSAPVNWCPQDQTVLANEQVIDGKCERCGSEVIQKDLEQWFFKIRDFADRLDKDLDKVDWPESTKLMQRNWIGKSNGTRVKFDLFNNKDELKGGVEIFTTRVDTIFGCSFLVLSPEHSEINNLIQEISNKDEVTSYIKDARNKTDLERQTQKEKSGVELKGVYAINPFNKKKVSVFIADYVLSGYGTGAIMAVPAHDERDNEFAKKYSLPIIEVIQSKEEDKDTDKLSTDLGVLINSEDYTGMNSTAAEVKMQEWLESKELGKKEINFRIRDWLVSRQRYWGCPIPVIYCNECKLNNIGYHESMPGIYPVDDRTDLSNLEFKNIKNALILHGTNGSSDDNWFQWLKTELENNNIKTVIPDLPVELDYETRIQFIEKNYSEYLTSDSIIIGHSSGGTFGLHIAEKYKLKKLILVAPVLFMDQDYKENYKNQFNENGEVEAEKLSNYSNIKYDLDKINKNVSKIYVLFGEKDKWIPTSQFIQYAHKAFPAAYIQAYKNYGHFNVKDDNLTKFPEILEYIANNTNKLPVFLPLDVDFKPTGESPILSSKEFKIDVFCPHCRKPAVREADTMDTFVDSSWYYFRYTDALNDKSFASKKSMDYMLPTDLYMIGTEHTVLHLLYSRFFTKFLFDNGYISFDEPFYKMRHMGTILGGDGRKMSKRWGNVINPDDEVNRFGADTVRMYEMFMGPLDETKPWNDTAENGVFRFLSKVWNLQSKLTDKPITLEEEIIVGRLIKKVSEDIESLSFNTAVSKYMEFINEISKSDSMSKGVWKKFLIVLAPFAPFITEEIYSTISSDHKSIHLQEWPEVDESILRSANIVIGVQINGKVRDTIEIPTDSDEIKVLEIAKNSEKINKLLTGEIVKVIYVKNKILNLIVK